MLHLIRHHRTRKAVLAALLPYAFAALFVNFFHVHDAVGDGVALCANHTVVSFEAPPTNDGQPFGPSDPCPACVWLKVSYRLEASISIAPSFHLLPTEIPVPEARTPRASSRQPASLRGPPSIAL
ncbi:MAG: hypothetical protein KGN76_12050 [Acidobacteriota bacterium]|nr:hypothetical protein [Acidobacteriota bacterium]